MASQGMALNGWDVVFNMGLTEINRSLGTQYEDLKKSSAFSNQIKIESKTQRREKSCSITRFEVEYGYPKLEFLENNTERVSLEMQILKGSFQSCDFAGKCEDSTEDKLDCDPKKEIAGQVLKATVPIDQIEGKVAPSKPGAKTYSVVLDFAKGAFSVESLQLSDEQKLDFNKAIQAYFTTHPVQYLINTLDLSDIATLPDLRPNRFVFKNLKTPAGERMLQLFIQTADRTAIDRSQAFLNNVSEPIPFGFECSLMISSKVFFGSVLPASNTSSGWSLKEVDPGGKKAWYAEYTGGNLTGTADFTKANFTQPGYRQGFGINDQPQPCGITYVFKRNQSIVWPVAGMTIKTSGDGKPRLNFEKTEHVSAETEYVIDLCGYNTPQHMAFGANVNVSAGGTLTMSVDGVGKAQKVKIALDNKSFDIGGRMTGGGPCGCDDLEAQLNQAIKAQVPSQMSNQLNITFEAISLFASTTSCSPRRTSSRSRKPTRRATWWCSATSRRMSDAAETEADSGSRIRESRIVTAPWPSGWQGFASNPSAEQPLCQLVQDG